MRKYWMGSVATAAIAVATSSGARAGTYIPVPMVPGAVSEIVFGINDSNVVAGSFRDSANVEHGFFGPLDGSNWTTFDAPFEGTTGTEARGIANDGAITGIALNPNFKVGEEFYRTPKGKFKIFSLDGNPLDGIAQGIAKQNDKEDVTVGDYNNATGMTAGYFGLNGNYKRGFKLHLHGQNKSPHISPRGVDDFSFGVGGFFQDEKNGVQHGFSQNRTAPKIETTAFDYPGATATALEDAGWSAQSGQWQDANGNFHAFIIVFDVGIVDLDPGDDSTSQQAWGVNKNDLVALSTSVGKSYIYCLNDSKKCPPGGFTKPEHISRPLISRSVSLP